MKWLWAAPLLLVVAFIVILTAVFPGWTWGMYDELRWAQQFLTNPSLVDFTRDEWVLDGRFRPLIATVVFGKFHVVGFDPHVLRILRVAEWLAAIGLTAHFLIRQRRVAMPFAMAGILFWLKSPPQLEQLHWWCLSELTATLCVVCALASWQRSRVTSYVFLILGTLLKEPMALFLGLPALLHRRYRHAAIATGVAGAYMLALYIGRRGYGTSYSAATLTAPTLQEVFRGAAIDFSFVAPILLLAAYLFAFRRRRRSTGNDALAERHSAAVFGAFGCGYFLLVLPKTWGYTYLFAPAIFCFGLSLAFALSWLAKRFLPDRSTLNRLLLAYLAILILLFSGRMAWNWIKVYKRMASRADLTAFIAMLPGKPRIGVNGATDNLGFGFAADLLKGDFSLKRREPPTCPYDDQSILDCCKGADYAAIGRELSNYEARVAEGRRNRLREVYANPGWRVFRCP